MLNYHFNQETRQVLHTNLPYAFITHGFCAFVAICTVVHAVATQLTIKYEIQYLTVSRCRPAIFRMLCASTPIFFTRSGMYTKYCMKSRFKTLRKSITQMSGLGLVQQTAQMEAEEKQV